MQPIDRFQYTPGESGTVNQIFRDLQASGWDCPIVVASDILSRTPPVERWSPGAIEALCASEHRLVEVDVRQASDGVMTHYDASEGGATFRDEASHERALMTTEDFFCIVHRRGANHSCSSGDFTPVPDSRYHSTRRRDYHARYDGPLDDFPCGEVLLLEAHTYLEDEHEPEKLQFTVGSGGVISTAQYDLENSLLAPVRGTKTVLLSPPGQASINAYELFPAGHPSIRQAQRHFNSTRPLSTATTSELSVFRTSVEIGEALWIPTGWFYHVLTPPTQQASSSTGQGDDSSGSTISFTVRGGANAQSTWESYDDWVLTHGIMRSIDFAGSYDQGNVFSLAVAMTEYVPTLLKALWDADRGNFNVADTIDEGASEGSAYAIWRRYRNAQPTRMRVPWMGPLETVVRLAYSAPVRSRWQLPPHDPQQQEPFPCHDILIDRPDLMRKFDGLRGDVRQDARSAAQYFIRNFKSSIRPHYLHFFLSGVLSEFDDGLHTGLRFADQCLLGY